MLGKFKKFLSILFIMFMIIDNNIVYALNNELSNTNMNALSAVVMEGQSGRILWGKNPYDKRAMASTTKIMTCIIALENGNLKDKVKVSQLAASQPKVKLYIKKGEEYILEDLLYALMLQSCNDVAVAIAEHIGGTVEAFCNMMTEKAKQIKALNTSFKTPNGLDADGHYSTAYDLGLITRYAFENKKFVEIINTRNHNISVNNGNARNFSLVNKNPLLNIYNCANGVKTGFTNNAGLCLVGAAKKNGMQLFTVVLGSGWPPHDSYRLQDTKKLLNYGFDNFKIKKLLNDKTDCKKVEVVKGKKEFVSTYIEGEFCYPICNDDQFNIIYDIPDMVEAPINKEDIIGYALLTINDNLCKTLPIKTKQTIEKVDFKFFLDKLINVWTYKTAY